MFSGKFRPANSNFSLQVVADDTNGSITWQFRRYDNARKGKSRFHPVESYQCFLLDVDALAALERMIDEVGLSLFEKDLIIDIIRRLQSEFLDKSRMLNPEPALVTM